jgi:hypothetical protein
MTPRELRLDGEKPVFEVKDRSELIQKRLLEIAKVINGWNSALNFEEIPLKLKLEVYENEVDFQHLTKKDYHKVLEAPKKVNKKTEEWYSVLNY